MPTFIIIMQSHLTYTVERQSLKWLKKKMQIFLLEESQIDPSEQALIFVVPGHEREDKIGLICDLAGRVSCAYIKLKCCFRTSSTCYLVNY